MQIAPPTRVPHDAAGACFADATPVSAELRQSAFASEVAAIAESVLRHHFPLLGHTIETGVDIDWRRDYVNGISTGTAYFRRIPYLDFSRAGDHKNVWELNRHQHLVVLAQAFLMTGKKEYLAEIATQMASWMEQNPFGRGINWTSALEVAFRALSWIRIDEMIGAHWAADFRGKVLSGVWQHGRYLESNLSIYFSPNTHLLGEAVVLHAIGLRLADSPRSALWRSLGDRIVHQEMERQVEADGSHFERSTYYHIYALDFFVLHAALAKPGAAFLQKLRRMAEFLASVMDDTGAIPLIGDDDGGRLFHPYGPRPRFGRASLAAAAVLLEHYEWPFATEDLHPFAAWLFGTTALDARGQRSTPPAPVLFRDCGLAVMRGGGAQVIVDAGSFGPGNAGHSHSDTLSIHVRSRSEELLIDPGTYTYVSDPLWRERFRGSAAHNTVRMDGHDQAVATGPFRWKDKPQVRIHEWNSTGDADFLDASCACRTGEWFMTHRRRVLLLKPDLLLIVDDIEGPPGEHTIEQFWHVGTSAETEGEPRVRIGSAVLIFAEDYAIEALSRGEFGWRSEVFGVKSPATAIRRYWRTTLPSQTSAVLALSEDAIPSAVGPGALFRFAERGFSIHIPPAGAPEIRRGT